MVAEVEVLSRLLPPPPRAVAGPPWETAAAEIGFAFPADYRSFVDRYGGGFLSSSGNAVELIVHAPCSMAARPHGPGGFRGFMDRTGDVRSEFDFDGTDDEIWYGDPLCWSETQLRGLIRCFRPPRRTR